MYSHLPYVKLWANAVDVARACNYVGAGTDFGDKKAVNNISFKAEDGEILGFLGPNGAGKSTTMNILTGYISCTDGKALY